MHAIRRAHTRARMGFVSVSELATTEPAEPITEAISTAIGAMEQAPLPPEAANSSPEQSSVPCVLSVGCWVLGTGQLTLDHRGLGNWELGSWVIESWELRWGKWVAHLQFTVCTRIDHRVR